MRVGTHCDNPCRIQGLATVPNRSHSALGKPDVTNAEDLMPGWSAPEQLQLLGERKLSRYSFWRQAFGYVTLRLTSRHLLWRRWHRNINDLLTGALRH